MTIPENDREVKQPSLAAFRALALQQPHLEPIVEFVASGQGGLYVAQQGLRCVETLSPTGGSIIIVGDDTERGSLGPAAFPGVRALLGKCQSCAVLEGAPMPAIYFASTVLASIGGAAVIIECQPNSAADWIALTKDDLGLPTIFVTATEGRA